MNKLTLSVNDESLTYCRGKIQVMLYNMGEGLQEDYDPNDPIDIPLLRFSVDKQNEDGEWEEIDDSSYCSCIDARTPIGRLAELLVLIMDEVYEWASQGHSIKKTCEKLSWLSAEGKQV